MAIKKAGCHHNWVQTSIPGVMRCLKCKETKKTGQTPPLKKDK